MRKKMIPMLSRSLLAVALGIGAAGVQAQTAYPDPQAAAQALHDALALNDKAALEHVLGAGFMRYVPEHSVNHEDVYAFLEAWSKANSIEMEGAAKAQMVVGDSGWRFPAPIVKQAAGWQFDLNAGRIEMQRRRIGRNELGAIDTLKTLCDAQKRYMQTEGKGQPAARIVSQPDARDGLYWPAPEDEPSPLGPDALVMEPDTPKDAALHGYHFRVLSGNAQGCAFAAWPAQYGSYGVNTFVIGADGTVRERDLGSATGSAATRLNAGAAGGWNPVR